MKFRITFQVVTPESAEQGEFAETGWENEEGVEVESLEGAAEFLDDRGAVEPSCVPYCGGTVFFSTVDPERDFKTGVETYYSFHPVGFAEDELEKLCDMLKGTER